MIRRLTSAVLLAFALLAAHASAKSPSVYVSRLSVPSEGLHSAHQIATLPITHFVTNRASGRSSGRTATYSLGAVKLGAVRTPRLAAGSSRKVKAVLTIPITKPGTYKLRACIAGHCKSAPVTVVADAPSISPEPLPTPVPQFIAFTASSVSFGGWHSTSDSVPVALFNQSPDTTSGPVTVSTVTDSGPGHFNVDSTDCGPALTPGSYCTANVSFTSVSFGATSGRVTATANPGGYSDVPLTGAWACTNPGLRSVTPRGC